MLDTVFITRYPHMSSLVILIAIHATTRNPFLIFSVGVRLLADKSAFINTYKTSLFIIFLLRHKKTLTFALPYC